MRPDLTMTPQRFADGSTLEREARDQVARDAEVAFGFELSVYAFAIVRQDFLQRSLEASQVSSSDNERLLRLLADEKIIQVRLPTMHPSDLAVEHIRTYKASAGSTAS